MLLWQKGGAYPLPQEHVLRLPFRFVLPARLQPSCKYDGGNQSAVVAYSVEVVGTRPGLHFNKRIAIPIPVLPFSLVGAKLRDILRAGRTIATKDTKFTKKIRRGVWGDFSDVIVTVSAELHSPNSTLERLSCISFRFPTLT